MSRPPSKARRRARELYARQFDTLGPAWANTAALIRSGWENLWITPAIDAMEALVLLCQDGGEEDNSEEAGRT